MYPEAHVHRARLYKLASLGFDRPDEELRGAFTSGTFERQLVESARALECEPLIDRAESAADRCPSSEDELEALTERYATRFGFEHGGEISQYEIEYGPGTVLTSTDTIADLSGFYRAFGLEKVDGYRDRSDHLCFELEFCSHLALQTAALHLDGDETGVSVLENAQADFLEDHLGRWVPRFREAVEAEANDSFYRALAGVTDELVAADADRFGVEPTVFPETPPSPTEQFLGDDEDGDFRCNGCGISSMPGQDPTATTNAPGSPSRTDEFGNGGERR
ncbi:TorD/DmsD family molecular chaperone [Natrarchaeobius oligotrophus]|uniref:Dehydrogenase n=1 Tax=Natrarchaeobius chitinivorans TaxID=1679083 RepID=A0A3N6M8L5_NATCH|nr:molecular chaperone TorD family protein [Natrarchaeobius chitinivorans]RQH00009.1 dehydrogenase [Natrarchaeobius chitinivorans]